MTSLLELHREREAQQIALEMVRQMGFEAMNFYLQERHREMIRECQKQIDRANRIVGRDFNRSGRHDAVQQKDWRHHLAAATRPTRSIGSPIQWFGCRKGHIQRRSANNPNGEWPRICRKGMGGLPHSAIGTWGMETPGGLTLPGAFAFCSAARVTGWVLKFYEGSAWG